MIDSALKYAGRGFKVFPVKPKGKPPLGRLAPNGVKDATTDKEQIRQWWNQVGDANIGVATGETFVIDLDVPDGPRSWHQMTEDKDVPKTLQVKTPSGGRHLYFQAPEGVQIKNSVSTLGDGVDVRGHGGYVIVPPSKITTKRYEYAVESGIAEAPFWLLSKVSRQKSTSTKTEEIEKAPDTIPKGQRNDKLASFAGYLRHKGLTKGEMLPALRAFNKARCDPPIGSLPGDADNEVEKIAESISDYSPSEAIQVRSANDIEETARQKELARRLLAVLWDCPDYGPIVKGSLPDPEALPSPYDQVFSEMLSAGLGSGDLDRVSINVSLNGELESVKNPDFDVGRYRGGDKIEKVVSWADSLKAQVQNQGIARDLEGLAKELRESDESVDRSFQKVIDRVQHHVEDSTPMVSANEAARKALGLVQRWKQGDTADVLHTWPALDDKIGGLKVGHMHVFGGFTSGFKTASLVDLAKRVAKRDNEDRIIPLFSAEMAEEEILLRMASSESGVPTDRLRPDSNGNVEATEQEYQEFESALDSLSNINVQIDPASNPTFDRMMSHCLQLKTQGDLAFVGFDYIEKMQEQADTEELRVSKIAQNLKRLAKELQIPVVVLSQYSLERSPHKRLPKNTYLRYSGKISHEAHTVIHWWYPKYFVDRGANANEVKRWDPSDPHAIYAVCTKNRNGPTLNSKLHVHEPTGRFIDKYDDKTVSDVAHDDSTTPKNDAPF